MPMPKIRGGGMNPREIRLWTDSGSKVKKRTSLNLGFLYVHTDRPLKFISTKVKNCSDNYKDRVKLQGNRKLEITNKTEV